MFAVMAPRTRQQAAGKVQPKLEELPGTTKPSGRKRKAASAPKASQPAEQKQKDTGAPAQTEIAHENGGQPSTTATKPDKVS